MIQPASHLRNLCIAAFAVLFLVLSARIQAPAGASPLPAPAAAPLGQQGNLTFTFANDSVSVNAGSSITALGTVQYTGSTTTTFTISPVIAAGWGVTVSPNTTITLGPGNSSVQLQFLITAPLNATSGASLAVTIRAQTGGLTAVDTLTITVPTSTSTPGPPDIDLQMRGGSNRDQEGPPNTTLTYLMRARNNGQTRVTVDLLFDATQRCSRQITDCTEDFGGSTRNIGIDPGASYDFEVRIYIPTSASAGSQANTRVIARTTSPSIVEASFVLTTRVTEASPTPTRTFSPTRTPSPSPTLAPVCEDNFENDDDRGSAKVIEDNLPQPEVEPVTGEQDDRRAICPSGDEDWLVFGGVAGKIYTIDILRMEIGLDLTLELFDEDGTSLVFNDDFFGRPSDQGGGTSDLRPRIASWRAPSTQRYYIRVRDSTGGGAVDFTYRIVLSSESYGPTPATISELCKDEFEEDGLPEQAHLITSNERQFGRRLCPTGDADWVKFFGKKDKRYFLYTSTASYVAGNPVRVNEGGDRVEAGADTVLVIADRDGVSVLDANDDIPGGNTLDSQVEFVPEVDGFYYAQIKNVGDIGHQFIFYDLTLELCVGPDVPCGRDISLPEPTARTITPTGEPTQTPTLTPEGEFSLDGTATSTPEEQ